MSHKPGPFTLVNKKHNSGRHRSKRSINAENKGRTVSAKALTKSKHNLSKMERRNQAKQHRMVKKEESYNKKRLLGGETKPPFLVAVVPLGKLEDPNSLLELVRSCDDSSRSEITPQGHVHVTFPRFKQRFTFVVPNLTSTWDLLDTVKACDTVLFLHVLDDITEELDRLISLIFAQGLPTTSHAIYGLESFPPKRRPEIKKCVTKFIEKRFNKEKLFNLESPTDALQLIRHIGQQKMREVKYRDSRPHLLGERIDFEPNSDQTSEGTLKVSGYVRGTTLDVNNPVYLQGLGDFQLSQIEVLQDPHPLSDRKAELGGGILRVERPDPSRQTSLQQDIPDLEMAESVSGEGPECMEEEGMMLAPKTRVRKLPPGTSDYQATWLTDSEGESGDDEEEDDDVSMDEYMAREDSEEDSEDDVSHIADDDATTVADTDEAKYDDEVEPAALKLMLNKLKDERKEQMYPDEVDLDPSESAQKRFAKYRPLKSFHQSEWDPNEGLPADYSRIVDFRHYRQIRNKVLAEEQEGCEPGSYVTLHIKNVPLAFYELHKEGKPLPVFGLLSYEHRMAMVNLAVEKLPECQASIKSKDRLVFVVGYRRYAACPIFSAHTVGKKYKYERFLPSDKTTMASLYAPVMMTPCPVLVFRDDGCQAEMVAKGSFHSIRSRRIIIKRAVLTGYSYSINKRSVVVRFMFFNREDILAFKSIKLHTRKGCQGEIREPVGTHGMMKCKFERKIASDDVIYMNLYKRVFPKWSYEPTLLAPSTQDCSME